MFIWHVSHLLPAPWSPLENQPPNSVEAILSHRLQPFLTTFLRPQPHTISSPTDLRSSLHSLSQLFGRAVLFVTPLSGGLKSPPSSIYYHLLPSKLPTQSFLPLCVHARSLAHFCLSLCDHGARQAPPSMGFSRQEYWSGLPCPPPGHLPDPGDGTWVSWGSCIAGRFFTAEPPGKPSSHFTSAIKLNNDLLLAILLDSSLSFYNISVEKKIRELGSQKNLSWNYTPLGTDSMPLGTLFHLFNFTLFIWEMGVIIIPTGYTVVVRMKQDYIRQVSNVTPGA